MTDTAGRRDVNVPNGDGRPSLTRDQARDTYRYLRFGMIGAIVLLTISILIEAYIKAPDCWQTSISAYYYTPVRAIFVSCLIALSLSLIVYKGRTPLEDTCLNLAGMLAPVVAVVPTKNIGTCWSLIPKPKPESNGMLADWYLTNIANNFYALLIAGTIGWVVALCVSWKGNQSIGKLETKIGLTVAAVLLGIGWWARPSLNSFKAGNWGHFYEHAHG